MQRHVISARYRLHGCGTYPSHVWLTASRIGRRPMSMRRLERELRRDWRKLGATVAEFVPMPEVGR